MTRHEAWTRSVNGMQRRRRAGVSWKRQDGFVEGGVCVQSWWMGRNRDLEGRTLGLPGRRGSEARRKVGEWPGSEWRVLLGSSCRRGWIGWGNHVIEGLRSLVEEVGYYFLGLWDTSCEQNLYSLTVSFKKANLAYSVIWRGEWWVGRVRAT